MSKQKSALVASSKKNPLTFSELERPGKERCIGASDGGLPVLEKKPLEISTQHNRN